MRIGVIAVADTPGLDSAVQYVFNTHREQAVKSRSSREVIRMLKADGWYEVDQTGSHLQFRHPTKKGRVTVPHPEKDLRLGTLRSIERQSGVKLR